MMNEREPLLRQQHAPQRRTSTHPYERLSAKLRAEGGCIAILAAVVLERFAYYGIVANLVLFLNMDPFRWMPYNATTALFIFSGISYVAGLIGGWIADSCLGKFRTIAGSFLMYIVGYALLLCLADDAQNRATTTDMWCSFDSHSNSTGPHEDGSKTHINSEGCSVMIMVALAVIGVANGIVRVNISPFGADQVKQGGPDQTLSFFTTYYWCLNIGALGALFGLSYLQQQYSFYLGYLVPTIALGVSLVIFLIGGLFYLKQPPTGSILCSVTGVLCEACKMNPGCCCCCCGPPCGSTDSQNSALASPTSYDSCETSTREASLGCLDATKISRGGPKHDHLVNDVKGILKIIAVCLAMIPYWMVYFQLQTTFVVQGLHMKLNFDRGNTTTTSEFKIPIAWLTAFDVICLIILLPVFNRLVYPALDRRNYTLPVRTRITIGMLFSGVAILVAGGLEVYRKDVYIKGGVHNQTIGNTTYNAADVSILWQIPQYVLIGMGEVFAGVGGLEMAYNEAPRAMSGLIMGLFMFTQGLGSMLGSASIYPFVNIWFGGMSQDQSSINCSENCHLDFYYFFLAGVQLLGVFLFMAVSKKLQVGCSVQHSPLQTRLRSGTPSSTASAEHSNRQENT